MIEFYSENTFELAQKAEVSKWISAEIEYRDYEEGEITYVFCDDAYLHKLNLQFLEHDTYTDIISFDNSLGRLVNAEIYISTERVVENATEFDTNFYDELHRVMIHGILHCCALKDKTTEEAEEMRSEENAALSRRHFI